MELGDVGTFKKLIGTTGTGTSGQCIIHLKSRISIRYDISKATAPAMPNLGKGTECIKILLSQASKDMYEPLVPMFFPILGAHINGAEFQYPDYCWKEPTGMMANLVGDSGCNKGQLSNLVEAICRDFRLHDEGELRKLVEWSKQVKQKASTKEKPARPDVAFYFPRGAARFGTPSVARGLQEGTGTNVLPR